VKYIYPYCALPGHARINTNAYRNTHTHTHTHTLQHTHAHAPVSHHAYMHAYTYTHRIVQSRVAPFVLGVEITARSDQQFTHLVQALRKCVRTCLSEKRTPSVDKHFYTHLIILCKPCRSDQKHFLMMYEHTWGGEEQRWIHASTHHKHKNLLGGNVAHQHELRRIETVVAYE